jgi:excisionase family DNA binding protein
MEKPIILISMPIHQFKDEMAKMIREQLESGSFENQDSKSKTILDTDQLMAKLGVTRPTLSKWRKENRIPFIQVGAVVRYDLDKVLEALESKKRRSR